MSAVEDCVVQTAGDRQVQETERSASLVEEFLSRLRCSPVKININR